MTEADTWIDSLEEDIREIGYTVLDLQAKAVAYDSKLEQVLATQLAHETRFDGLETRFDGLDTRFDGLDTRFDGLQARFERGFASQDSRFDRIDALLAEVLSRLSQPPQ